MEHSRQTNSGPANSGPANGWRARVAGVRTTWRAVDDGKFFCDHCGGDRSYRRLTGRRRLTVLGLPLLPRGEAPPVVECASCRHHFPPGVLARPTTTRLSALLREGVQTVALALLAVGGTHSAAARRVAAESLRAAGFPEYTEEQLVALAGGTGTPPALDDTLRTALAALVPHLARPGRERLLLWGARIALSDGPYTAAERQVLGAIGCGLRLGPADTEELLAAATPS